MVSLEHISKSFGGRPVIQDINGVFEKGKCNLIIGSSGTGKSVLLKCIVGLIHPAEGHVRYDNRAFTNADRAMQAEVRREMGRLFQARALFACNPVNKNDGFPRDVRTSMPAEEKPARVHFWLKRVGLEN